jgi:hypothetical protein
MRINSSSERCFLIFVATARAPHPPRIKPSGPSSLMSWCTCWLACIQTFAWLHLFCMVMEWLNRSAQLSFFSSTRPSLACTHAKFSRKIIALLPALDWTCGRFESRNFSDALTAWLTGSIPRVWLSSRRLQCRARRLARVVLFQ